MRFAYFWPAFLSSFLAIGKRVPRVGVLAAGGQPHEARPHRLQHRLLQRRTCASFSAVKTTESLMIVWVEIYLPVVSFFLFRLELLSVEHEV